MSEFKEWVEGLLAEGVEYPDITLPTAFLAGQESVLKQAKHTAVEKRKDKLIARITAECDWICGGNDSASSWADYLLGIIAESGDSDE